MQKIYNILAYGESIKHWYSYDKPNNPNFVTIGVNHVTKLAPVDYLLLVDHPSYFTAEKIETIRIAYPLNYLICDYAWMFYLDKFKCVPVSLTDERSNLRTLFADNVFCQLPYSYNSPFIAACLAIRMGATEINLFGVDFNSDSAVDYNFHGKNIRDFEALYLELVKRKIKMFTTPESQLSKFIPINQNLKIHD